MGYVRTLHEATITLSGLTNSPDISFVENVTIAARERAFSYQDVEQQSITKVRQAVEYEIRLRYMPTDWNVQKAFDADETFTLTIQYTSENDGTIVTETYTGCRFENPSATLTKTKAVEENVVIRATGRTIA
ncbi:hypothetical protein [Kosmotoga pacifica]|uniref:Uncharacterized protein n=1 Tax=Kosmotoga pacifica TaxID=1330330 RepID=A0A0G2Z938_9BACT|nr:hypothetical protein [Kosmotoga pacifica]AKI96586.1 hypothetical protein IX53_00730 [Kosmotoga pacifica]